MLPIRPLFFHVVRYFYFILLLLLLLLSTATRVLRWLFFNGLVRLVTLVVLGLNARHRERLPRAGPEVLVANHNSHLDTLVRMMLLPARLPPRVQPVAAADCFLKHRLLAWFTLEIVGILPIRRHGGARAEDPLAPLDAALTAERILILFPEGTRGEPVQRSRVHKGVARLAERQPEVPVVPMFLHGLAKALPRGEALLVPFFCDVFVGEPVPWGGDWAVYLRAIEAALQALAAEGAFAPWE